MYILLVEIGKILKKRSLPIKRGLSREKMRECRGGTGTGTGFVSMVGNKFEELENSRCVYMHLRRGRCVAMAV